MEKKKLILAGIGVAVLTALLTVGGVATYSALTREVTPDECMISAGYNMDEPPGDNFTWEGMREAVEECDWTPESER